MISKEAERSIAASAMFPGFRFSPTDEELILYYLKKKVDGFHQCVELIPEVDICKHEPWDLPAKSIIQSDSEWFFFSPRGKKYPNGSQSKRATEIGYWKATGKERAVKSGLDMIGSKRTLVFHIGRAPKGERTEWIMHEYCMAGKGQDSLVVCRIKRKHDIPANTSENIATPSSNSFSMMNSAGMCQGCMPDVTGASGGDKAAEKKPISSSYGSHSVEQTDSPSESDRKIKDEILQPESSRRHMNCGNIDDDCFAEIMNDNIVELDESSPASTSPVPDTNTGHSITIRAERTHRPSDPHFASRTYPSQGTANRRIRLRKLRGCRSHEHEHEEHTDENDVPGSDDHPERSGRFLWQSGRLRKKFNSLYKVVIIMSVVLVLFLSLFGVAWYVCY